MLALKGRGRGHGTTTTAARCSTAGRSCGSRREAACRADSGAGWAFAGLAAPAAAAARISAPPAASARWPSPCSSC